MNKLASLILATLLLMFVLIFTIKMNAQTLELEQTIKKAEKNIKYTLNHEIPSVSESALFNLVILKNKYPDVDLNIFIGELKNLALEGSTSKIKYKAQLTLWYITHSNEIEKFAIEDKSDREKYFNLLADNLQSKFIASN